MIKAGEGNPNIETFYMPPSYKILLQLSAANAYGPNHEQLFKICISHKLSESMVLHLPPLHIIKKELTPCKHYSLSIPLPLLYVA